MKSHCQAGTGGKLEVLGTLSFKKKTVKKGDIVRAGRGGVNPSSFFKPKFTGFSNHSEMDF